MGVLSDQRLAAVSVAKDLLVKVGLNETVKCDVPVSVARQQVFERQAEELDRQEKELIAELQQAILCLSAKIDVVRTLRNAALREAGKQEGMRLAIGADANEKTTSSACRIGNQARAAPPGQNTI